MRDVYQASSLLDAQLLVDRLEAAGIKTFVRNTDLIGAVGELPASLLPVVSIRDLSDWARAQKVIEEFNHARLGPPGVDRICGECSERSPGNFELCWSCRAPFPLDS